MNMKVALVHDYLNQFGGGERVLSVLMEMFPEAPVYTILHDEKKTGGRFAGRVRGASFLNFQFAKDHHRLFIPLMPSAAEALFLGGKFDLIISDTAGFAKGITYDAAATRHISYIHTPLRYAWETKDYFQNPVFTKIFSPVFAYLRNWDRRMAQRPDALLANSRFIAGKIKNYYQRDAAVVYPPVDTALFYREVKKRGVAESGKGGYYLAAGRMLGYKRFDLVVEAFARLGRWLKIAGAGPEREAIAAQIKKLGAANIELLPFADDEALRKLYNNATAVIFPQVEDFGLVAAEAQICGAPVIAYAAGGATEIVEDGTTGMLFHAQTPGSLAAAVEAFEKKKWSRVAIARSARRFSKEAFKTQMFDQIAKLS